MKSPFALSPDTLAIRNDPEFRIQTALFWNRHSSIDLDHQAYLKVDDNGGESGPSENTKLYIRMNSHMDDAGFEDLSLHRDRLAAAAEQLGWNKPVCLEMNEAALPIMRENIDKHINQLPPLHAKHIEQRKVRILVDSEGHISVDSIAIDVAQPVLLKQLSMRPYVPRSLDEAYESTNELCKVYLDLEPSQPSILTSHKTTYRYTYDSARARVKLSPKSPPTAAEVLLYNFDCEIFDASSCTVYIKRDGLWVTPAAACGPTLGVTRRVAINDGLCEEGIIKLKNLVFNETLWLSNAVRGFFRGVLAVDSRKFND